MPTSLGQKPKATFSRGLITEASGLNFPEDASVDELNVDLIRDGSRRRRKGVVYENGYTDLSLGYTAGNQAHVHKWENAGNVPGLTFVVVQIDDTLHFFAPEGDTVSDYKKSFTVNLTTYNSPFGSGAGNSAVNVAQIKGKLIVVSENINSICVEYDPDTDALSVSEIQFRIRDFEWLGDRTTYETSIPITDPSLVGNDDRRYDQKNAGWTQSVLNTYIAAKGALPPLTHPWYSAKNASGAFDLNGWEAIYAGSSILSNGHYILDLYNQDRRTASALVYPPNYVEKTRFKTVVPFAGRVFYSGMTSEKYTNAVFFSQIVDSFNKIGELFQSNDPTSEEISDLLATDGGVIYIEGAYNIKKLHVLGPSVLVFAENGVWQIRGIDNIFKATDFAVTKVSSAGLSYDNSYVNALGRVYWWNTAGIYTIRASEENQVLTGINISLDTIQSFYDSVSKREEVRSAYDETTTKVFWFYPVEDETVEGKLRRVLIFDEAKTAFVPWEVANSSSYILDAIALSDDFSSSVEVTVVDSSGTPVVDSGGDEVIITGYGANFFSSSLKLLCVTNTGGITFAEFTGSDFLDWGLTSYSSYLEDSHDFLGSLTNKKTGIYVTPFFKVTETTVVDNAGSLELDLPSSCFMSTLWDFSRAPTVISAQVYKLFKLPSTLTAGALNYPDSVISTRNRIRGRGRSLQIRFESEQEKDFHLLGYDLIFGANSNL